MFSKLYEKIKLFIKSNYKNFIIFIFILFIAFFEFPYVVYTPGGIVPLEERIIIEDGYESKGSFNMSYVSMRKGTIPMILLSYVLPNWDLINKDEITVSDESVDDLIKMEKLYLESSIDNATIVAFNKANKEVKVNNTKNNIIFIDEEANTNLKLYDELISVDENTINDIKELQDYISTKNAGDIVTLKVKRKGEIKNCTAKVHETSNGLKIGIAFLNTYDYVTNPKVEVKTKSSESGSSGGLMLTLAIYNALINEDITKGKTIVGTGTIDVFGNVGSIDGIKYKILGAVKNKADLFICPVENYDEAISVKKKLDLDIRIEKVETFDDALGLLSTLENVF